MKLTVARVDTYERFLALEKPWESLLAGQPQPDFFLSHLWMTTLLDHFGGGMALNCLVLKDDNGNLQGVAPLALVRKHWRGVPVRVLQFISDQRLDMPRGDFMLGEDPQSGIRAFIEYLSAHRQTWDVLNLTGFLSNSPYLGLFEETACEFGLFVSPQTVKRVPRILPIETDWESHLQIHSGNFRRNLAKERKKLETLGTVTFSLYTESSEVTDGLNKMMSIILNHLGVKSFDELNSTDRNLLEFTQDLSRRLTRKHAVEIKTIEINAQPVACLLSFIRDNVVYPFLTKYDPAFEAASPGRAVIMNLVQDAFTLGYREIDFLSSWNYLSRFTPYTRQYMGVTVFHQGWFSRMLCFGKHTITPFFRRIKPVICQNRGHTIDPE